MTIQEMHYDFRVKLDKVNSYAQDSFNEVEIDHFLNEATLLFVKQRASIMNPYRRGLEVSQKRVDDLRTLVVKSPTTLQPGIPPSVVGPSVFEMPLADLSFPYLKMIRLTTEIKKKACPNKVVTPDIVSHDDLSEALSDPFQRPDYRWDTVLMVYAQSTTANKGSVYFYTDETFQVTKVFPEYLRRPVRVSLGGYTYLDGTVAVLTQSDLPEEVHSEMVDIAVSEAARTVEDVQMYQLKQHKLVTHE